MYIRTLDIRKRQIVRLIWNLSLPSSKLFRAVLYIFWVAEGVDRSINRFELDRVDISAVSFYIALNNK